MKRVAVFVHFDCDNIIKDYVFYYLKQLKLVANKIIFVSTSNLNQKQINDVLLVVDKAIIRDNIGYDFFSYKKGIEEIDCIESYDEIILCNDSCLGPIYPLVDIFSTMELHQCDAWGITANRNPILHLQSYFLVFRKSLFLSDVFKKFWSDLKVFNEKADIIRQYELGLSSLILKNDYKIDSFVPLQISVNKCCKKLRVLTNILKKIYFKVFSVKVRYLISDIFRNSDSLDCTLYYWDYMILFDNMPFIKKSLLIDACVGKQKIVDFLSKHTQYDVSLIEQ